MSIYDRHRSVCDWVATEFLVSDSEGSSLRIIIFEPAFQGHYFVYLSHMLPELIELVGSGKIVLQTSDPALKSVEFANLIRPFADRIEIRGGIPNEWQTAGASGSARRVDQVIQAVRDAEANHLIVPLADGIGHGLALRRVRLGGLPKGVTSEGLYFQGKFLYPCASLGDRIRERVKWEIGRQAPFTFMHHLDPIVYDWEKQRAHSAGDFEARWSLMPDPIEPPRPLSKPEARRALGVPDDGRLIGCAGVIDLRKGCDLMMRAFARARLGPTDRMVIAGPHKPEIRAMLSGELRPLVDSGRLISIDRVLRPDELADSLAAMDLVCTPYPNHIGSASIVIRAAATPRPVLGSDFGWVRRSITTFDLGWTCPVADIESFASTMEVALDGAADWKPGEPARRFAQFHDYRNFKLCATRRVRQLLGKPDHDSYRSWGWVMESVAASNPGMKRSGLTSV